MNDIYKMRIRSVSGGKVERLTLNVPAKNEKECKFDKHPVGEAKIIALNNFPSVCS